MAVDDINMDAVAESERNLASKISPYSAGVRRIVRLTRDGMAESFTRDQILRREQG